MRMIATHRIPRTSTTFVAIVLAVSACGTDDGPTPLDAATDGDRPADTTEAGDDGATDGSDSEDDVVADDGGDGDDPFAEDPFADDDPFGPGEDAFDDDHGTVAVDGLPPELAVFAVPPPGARIDFVEVFDGPHGAEYSFDASYHDGGHDELQVAAEHYRSTVPGAGWEIVEEFVDADEAHLYLLGHGLAGSIAIDLDMGSVWINTFLAPEM